VNGHIKLNTRPFWGPVGNLRVESTTKLQTNIIIIIIIIISSSSSIRPSTLGNLCEVLFLAISLPDIQTHVPVATVVHLPTDPLYKAKVLVQYH